MFDMKSIGRKIAACRRQKNLTQMELADLLNISFQAVSNWERGETMPDVSKLPELAKIFQVSIDEILGNQQSTKIIEKVIEGNPLDNEISLEDFKSVAPLLKPNQIGEISKGIGNIDHIEEIIDYLPFVSIEVADKIAQKCIDSDQLMLDECIPFVSRDYADRLVLKAMEKGYILRDLVRAFPFVDRETADKIIEKYIDEKQIMLDECVPFISREYADKLAIKALEEGYTLKDLVNAFPFISRETADRIIEKCIEEGSIMLDKCLPFISREYADKLVLKALEKGYGLKNPASIIPFISKEIVNKLIQNKL
jgi:transcriptional regulator with XRE-family HTH domain